MRVFSLLSLVVPALVALTGCPPTGLTNTCHFEGETTACGQCIRASCHNQIDSECASSIRDDATLSALDDCASGKGCAAVISSTGFNGVGDCVKDAPCAAQCPIVGSVSTAQLSCDQQTGGTCQCVVGTTSTGQTCGGPESADSSQCCVSADWPAIGATCTCFRKTCRATDQGCECSLVTDVSGPTKAQCTGSTCCQTDNACTCYTNPTFCVGTEVASCTVDDIPVFCPSASAHTVTSCF